MILEGFAYNLQKNKIEIATLKLALEPFKGSERGGGVSSMCDDVKIPANQDFICSICFYMLYAFICSTLL